jgi:dTDP-4-amino-4,6-dideoxygalactose transaminase
MAVPLLDLKTQYTALRDEVVAAVTAVLDSQQFILGATVAAFEGQCAAYCAVPHALGVSSGTDALLLALMGLGIGPGDEVITSPFSFFATAGCVHRVGATPVFVDIDEASFNLDPAGIEARITPRTKAILPVHLFGRCADMDAILDIAKRHGLFVIEDAAQAIGSEFAGRRAGSMGDVGCFSFFPSKNLGGVGDGGLVTCRDPALHARMTQLRNHGSHPKYFHAMVGGNFRLDAIQAAVLGVKLPHLDDWTAGRQRNAAAYRERLADLQADGRLVLPSNPPGMRHIWNQFTLRVPGRRDALQAFLKDRGIGTEVYYPRPLHVQECFAYLGYRPGDMPQAERASAEALSIPIFPELTPVQIDETVAAIRAFFAQAPA